LSSTMLSDLRLYTRARICYALTAASIAGAIAQSNVFDYRIEAGSHFGAPLSSVEIKLMNSNESELEGARPRGRLVVTGPAVSGGEVNLGVSGSIVEDGTLRLV